MNITLKRSMILACEINGRTLFAQITGIDSSEIHLHWLHYPAGRYNSYPINYFVDAYNPTTVCKLSKCFIE